VIEDFTADLSEGSGTGVTRILGSGDGEGVCIDSGEYWLLPSKYITGEIEITYDQYETGYGGATGIIEYRTGATRVACEAALWNTYVGHFTSLSWVQVRLSVS